MTDFGNYPDNMDWAAHDDAFGYLTEANLPAPSYALLALGEFADRMGWQDLACDCVNAVVGEDSDGSDQHDAAIRREADDMAKMTDDDLIAAIRSGLAASRRQDAAIALSRARWDVWKFITSLGAAA